MNGTELDGREIFVREDRARNELSLIKNNGEGIFLELNLRKIKWLFCGGYNHKKIKYHKHFK